MKQASGRLPLRLYDNDMKPLQDIPLKPVPYRYELPVTEALTGPFFYQVSVKDKDGREDRSSLAGMHDRYIERTT